MNNFDEIQRVLLNEISYIEYNRKSCLDGKPIKPLLDAIHEYANKQSDQTKVISAMIISFNLYANSFPASLINSIRDHLSSSRQLPESIRKEDEVINKYLDARRDNLILSPKAIEVIDKSLHSLSKDDLIKSANELVLVLEDTIEK